MIRYALSCDNGHAFESWFPSSASYDAQATRGLVACPICDSPNVGKQLMAPSIGRKGTKSGAARDAAEREAVRAAPETAPDTGAAPEAAVPAPVALMSERDGAMRAMLRAMREHVTQNAEHVGPRFASEARRMHYGEIEHRSIYGEATPTDARALAEEGIEVHAIPVLPDDRN